MEGSQNSKSRSNDPLTTPFDLVLHFFDNAPVVNLSVKFDMNISIDD